MRSVLVLIAISGCAHTDIEAIDRAADEICSASFDRPRLVTTHSTHKLADNKYLECQTYDFVTSYCDVWIVPDDGGPWTLDHQTVCIWCGAVATLPNCL